MAIRRAALDGLWLGGILRGLWRVLEHRLAEEFETRLAALLTMTNIVRPLSSSS